MDVPYVSLLIGLLVLVLFLVLVAGVVVAAIWYSRQRQGVIGRGGPSMPPPGALTTDADALETLRRRYARGEITREQYLEIRQDLLD